ncbi:MAG: hypothetical protein GY870_19025 [archaeon]|nr:hypothetical protein [archaeon]
MHEKGIRLINRAMKKKKIMGLDLKCEYRPCHSELEDCTFCYCCFYPCNIKDTGGKIVISSTTGKPVWDCSFCILPHKTKNAKLILDDLVKLGPNISSISKKDLINIRLKIIEQDN